MLQFDTLIGALNYREHCPVCRYKLKVNDRDIANQLIGKDVANYNNISFFTDAYEQNIMTIDPNTGDIRIDTIGEDAKTSSPFLPKTKRAGTQFYGLFMHSLTIECYNETCSQYGYVLQVHVDMKKRKLCGLFLNSEWIAVEEKCMTVFHEIKCNYATRTTCYGCYKNSQDHHYEMPLIPLNVADPDETIDKIRKILVFS